MVIENLTPIQKFYEGKTIFITGATGFVGKVLLEKFLRCCPGVNQIYIMVREKRGKTAKQRVDELLDSELFDVLKKERPDFSEKVSVVYGNLESPSLGISLEDFHKLKENVNFVFHTAARVKWDEALRQHARTHIIASGILIEMAKKFKKLEAFVYVSSAAVHRDPDFTVPEHVAKKHISPNQLLDALQWMDDETVQVLTPRLTKEESMTYLLAKALTENVIEETHGYLPTAIVRPAIVFPTHKEPYPGWCDTLQSLQGLALAAAKGILRTIHIKPNIKLWCIPVDLVANTIITTAWHMGTSKPSNDVLVVNSVLEHEKLPVMDKKYFDMLRANIRKYPLANIFRYPELTVYSSTFLYTIHAFFDQYIPAAIIDILMYMCTGKTMMIRLYKKINMMCNICLKFGSEPWICKMENNHMIRDRLSKEDAKIFLMDASDIDWEQYTDDMFFSCRKLLADEDYSNLRYARTKARIWWFVTTTLKWLAIFCIVYFICTRFYN